MAETGKLHRTAGIARRRVKRNQRPEAADDEQRVALTPDAVTRLRNELRTASGKLKYKGGEYEAAKTLGKPKVCYGSPLVDIAATNELAIETGLALPCIRFISTSPRLVVP